MGMGKIKAVMMLGMLFLLIGAALQITAIVQEFSSFAPLQEQYYSVSKADRDAAPTGSALSQQLVEISKFPPKLMTFKLVGIGSILVGVFFLLGGILMALKMMPHRLAKVMRRR